MRFDRVDAMLIAAASSAVSFLITLHCFVPMKSDLPTLYHCTIDDSQRQSGLPRACIVPATSEKNARRIAEDRCHWHGKTFYCVPMTKNYPDVIQMEITP